MPVKPIDLQVNIQNLPNVAREQAEINLKPIQQQMINSERFLRKQEEEKFKTEELQKNAKAENSLQHESLNDYIVREEAQKKNQKKKNKREAPSPQKKSTDNLPCNNSEDRFNQGDGHYNFLA